jgi:uncharacterized low-complexity protein
LQRPSCSIALFIGISAVCLAGVAGAQESLDRGKSAAQLFASHCSACHKSPQGLTKSGGLFGLEGFLREHYMTSRETAVAMSNYLKAMDTGPARGSKRAAKGDDKPKVDGSKKPAAKPGQGKTDADDPKSSGAKALDGKPGDILTPEPRVAEPRSRAPAGEPKPADAAKPDKSDKSD